MLRTHTRTRRVVAPAMGLRSETTPSFPLCKASSSIGSPCPPIRPCPSCSCTCVYVCAHACTCVCNLYVYHHRRNQQQRRAAEASSTYIVVFRIEMRLHPHPKLALCPTLQHTGRQTGKQAGKQAGMQHRHGSCRRTQSATLTMPAQSWHRPPRTRAHGKSCHRSS